MSKLDYKEIASNILGYVTQMFPETVILDSDYIGTVVAKERPRVGANSVYTAPRTRKFEASVREWAEDELIGGMVLHPVSVSITVRSSIPKSWDVADRRMAEIGLIFENKADIDNKAKSILDALNGIAYKDDSQISRLEIVREFSAPDGFSIVIRRSGLSRNEARNVFKYMKMLRAA